MPEQREPTQADVAAAAAEVRRFLSTRLKKPLDVPVGRISALALPGDEKVPIEMGSWRVETFGSLVELGRLLARGKLLLDAQLGIYLFLYLAEECGLTEPGAIPTKGRIETN